MELTALNKIFKTVLNNFIWMADGPYKVEWRGGNLIIKDHWDLMEPDERDVLRGDCEDFCLYCSKLLKEHLEIPKAQRLLTYTEDELGGGHMILCIKDGDNEYVFDNRQRQVTTLSKLKRIGYKNFARPEGSVAGPWKHI